MFDDIGNRKLEIFCVLLGEFKYKKYYEMGWYVFKILWENRVKYIFVFYVMNL